MEKIFVRWFGYDLLFCSVWEFDRPAVGRWNRLIYSLEVKMLSPTGGTIAALSTIYPFAIATAADRQRRSSARIQPAAASWESDAMPSHQASGRNK